MHNGYIDPVKVDEALTHITTLKVFIHFKLSKTGELGIRETQKALGKSSTSSITYHFKKLSDVNLVRQLPNNRYELTEAGHEYNDIRVPIFVSANFIRGIFVPRMFIVVTMIAFVLVFNIAIYAFFSQVDQQLIILNSFFVVIFALVFFLREWWTMKSQFEEFYNLKK